MIDSTATSFPPIPSKGFCYPPEIRKQPIVTPPPLTGRDDLEKVVKENILKFDALIKKHVRQEEARERVVDSEEEEDEEKEPSYEDQEYEVEEILDMRILADGSKQYKVSWKHFYGEERESWTSENAIKNCPQLLENFQNSRHYRQILSEFQK